MLSLIFVRLYINIYKLLIRLINKNPADFNHCHYD